MALRCTTCNKPAFENAQLKHCSRCESALYCSTACQKEDWPIHKHVCEQFKATTTTNPRPSLAHKLALILPVDEAKPKLVWMKFEEKTEAAEDSDDSDAVYETPDFTYLGDGGSPQLLVISRTMKAANLQLQRFDLEDSVVIYLRGAGSIDGSRTNACVSALVKGSGRFNWRGPLIVLGQPGTAFDPLIHRDIVPMDLRLAVDYLRSYDGFQVHPFEAISA
jgi:hypothetical protein